MTEIMQLGKLRKLEESVYGGARPANAKVLENLKKQGFGAIVSVEPLMFKERVSGISYLKVNKMSQSPKDIRNFFRIYARTMLAGKKVYIHCVHGFGGPELVYQNLRFAKQFSGPTRQALQEELKRASEEKKRNELRNQIQKQKIWKKNLLTHKLALRNKTRK